MYKTMIVSQGYVYAHILYIYFGHLQSYAQLILGILRRRSKIALVKRFLPRRYMSVSNTYPVAQLKVFIQYGIAPIVFDSVKYFKEEYFF